MVASISPRLSKTSNSLVSRSKAVASTILPAGRPVAALVHRRANQIINPVWRRGDKFGAEPEATERNGYGILHWVQDGMELWAVSDVDPVQLRRFVQSWRQSP